MDEIHQQTSLMRLRIALLAALVAFAFVAPAYGDSLTLKPVVPKITLTEGVGSVFLEWVLTNHTDETITVSDWGFGGGPVFGDQTDTLFDGNYFPHVAVSDCVPPLAPGGSCIQATYLLQRPSAVFPVETKRDSGTQDFFAFVTTDNGLSASGSIDIKVEDAAVAAEPTSVLLLGTGTLLLAGVSLLRRSVGIPQSTLFRTTRRQSNGS